MKTPLQANTSAQPLRVHLAGLSEILTILWEDACKELHEGLAYIFLLLC